MTETKLKTIATEMIEYARLHPRLNTSDDINQYRRRLSGGLRLVLYLDRYSVWRLSLYRGNKPPSPTEVETVRRDFQVPAAAKKETEIVHSWKVIRLSWPDPPRISQPPLINNHLSEEK